MTNPSFLDKALALAAEGLRVFPLIEGGKKPAIIAWQHRASYDPVTIRKFWNTYDAASGVTRERNFNIGIATGAMRGPLWLLVLDVDVKKGARGLESMAELEALHPGWCDGVGRVQTPSGGFHLYFVSKIPLATTASKVGPGIDTRGVGGYVVAAGSVLDGVGPYVDVVDLLS